MLTLNYRRNQLLTALVFIAAQFWAVNQSLAQTQPVSIFIVRHAETDSSQPTISKCFPPLMEAMGKAMSMGMVYSLATLKAPNMQVGFEKAGWQLIGIIPGFDRELVSPGQVKRVYEAIYVKVLVTESEFLCPIQDGMTPATNALFKLLYPAQSHAGKEA